MLYICPLGLMESFRGFNILKMKHYLYRHIRIDKNEPFYIGIGTKSKKEPTMHESEYRRAFTNNKRSNFWKSIVSKTDYEVEILLESDDYEFIKQKEIEFIALYGRADLGLGTLCNLTDGGDGVINRVHTEQSKKRYSEASLKKWENKSFRDSMSGENSYHYGKKLSEEIKRKLSEAHKGKEGLKGDKNPMYHRKGELSPHFGKPRSEETKIKIGEANSGDKHGMAKRILDTSTNIIYNTMQEAALAHNINYSTLSKYLTGSRTNKTTLIFYIEIHE